MTTKRGWAKCFEHNTPSVLNLVIEWAREEGRSRSLHVVATISESMRYAEHMGLFAMDVCILEAGLSYVERVPY